MKDARAGIKASEKERDVSMVSDIEMARIDLRWADPDGFAREGHGARAALFQIVDPSADLSVICDAGLDRLLQRTTVSFFQRNRPLADTFPFPPAFNILADIAGLA